VDETHAGWYGASAYTKDVGGDFSMTKQEVRLTPTHVYFVGKDLRQPGEFPKTLLEEYKGILLPPGVPTSVPWPPSVASSRNDLINDGTTAIARCKPTNSVADLAVFLGEIYKDGLTRIGVNTWENRTALAAQKRAAGDYLTYEFALKPLVSDVKKFFTAVKHADKVINQYQRDSGRVVRRRYTFPTVKEQTLQKVTTGWPTTFTSVLRDTSVPFGTTYRRRETVIRKWFSGAFTYHLDIGDDRISELRNYAQRADKLLGISLTPDLLWEVAPWSWAVDWFSNAGDVLSNVSDWASDGLVMRYGYIMEHSSVKDTYYFSGPTSLKSSQVRPQTVEISTEVKQRVRANPFGFGLTWDGLSVRQGAILAALGITRKG